MQKNRRERKQGVRKKDIGCPETFRGMFMKLMGSKTYAGISLGLEVPPYTFPAHSTKSCHFMHAHVTQFRVWNELFNSTWE